MTNLADNYNRGFYSSYRGISYNSAKEVLPIVNSLVSPKSVVDVGCGVGVWLKVWKELGVRHVLGIDGSYVNQNELAIDRSEFVPMNLSDSQNISRKFDLVQSLEVAEHIPSDRAARFVDFLCSMSPVILFGAAIPFQGGTLHINEQWPEYWAELFQANGYTCCDAIRRHVWNSSSCAYYYAQNTFLYVKSSELSKYPALDLIAKDTNPSVLSSVHPKKWMESQNIPFENLLSRVPKSLCMLLPRLTSKIKKMRK